MNKKFTVKNQNLLMAAMAGAFALLAGCEAKLDLTGVEASKEKATARYDNYQSAAQSSDTAVIIGNRGVMLVSKDQGESWIRKPLPGNSSISFPTLVDIETCPNNRFIALDTDRKIWISDENAENWTSKAIPTEEEVLDLTCGPNGDFWVVGSFTLILHSTDQGDNWIDKSIAEDAMFSRIQFIDRQNAFVSGEFGSVYFTRDGGESWEPANLIPNEFYPMASHFISPTKGWVGGLQGIIFQTEDGGQNWVRQDTGTVAPIYNIFQVNGSVFAIGEQGTILKLNGKGWDPIKANLGFGYIRAALPIEGDKFLVAGGGGLIKILNQQDLN